MKLGAAAPRESLNEGPQVLAHVARVSEESDIATVWMSDHVVMVDDPAGYPYTGDGSFARGGATPWHEAFTVLSWLAALTRKVKVGTSILVLPLRNPLEVAKVTATLDQLSRGRLLLGVGAGWLEKEFQVLGADFLGRGLQLDSAIDLLKQAWTGLAPAGRYGRITLPFDVHCQPVPYRPEGVAILVGGMSRPAVDRSIARGDGWLARVWVDDFVDDPEPTSRLLQKVANGIAQRTHKHTQPYNVVRLVRRSGDQTESSKGSSLSPLVERAVLLAREVGFDEAAFDIDWLHPDLTKDLRRLGSRIA